MTHGLFLFEIRGVFYQLGKEAVSVKPHEIEAHVKALLEERAFDTYHSLLWQQAENIALDAFRDGLRHSGYGYY